MKTLKTETVATIALLLILTIVASSFFAFLPTVNAQTMQQYPTFLYAAAAPNPVDCRRNHNHCYMDCEGPIWSSNNLFLFI